MKNKQRLNLQLFAENPEFQIKTNEEYREAMQKALETGNTEEFTQAFTDMMSGVEQRILAEAKGSIVVDDSNILQQRGVRQLTSKEKQYYSQLSDAMQSVDPANSLTSIETVMPQTIIDNVFEDLRTEHEILKVIDFKNITGITKILLNTNVRQLAHWGPLNDEIKKELKSGFTEVDITQNKLSAYMFVSQDMLDLGPVYIDRYVREVLFEALACGLEKGIISGTGKNEPIGMDRDTSDTAAVVGGVYPEQKATKVENLDPIVYGELLAKMAKTRNGNPRKISNVMLVVNPQDYFKKIFPATTIRGVDGTYRNNILPFPTDIVQSVELDEGKAILGLPTQYFMGMGLVKDGKIEYSDEYKFLEDYRTYKIRFLGHGQPKDDLSFILLDISELKPANLKVLVEGENGAEESGEKKTK